MGRRGGKGEEVSRQETDSDTPSAAGPSRKSRCNLRLRQIGGMGTKTCFGVACVHMLVHLACAPAIAPPLCLLPQRTHQAHPPKEMPTKSISACAK